MGVRVTIDGRGRLLIPAEVRKQLVSKRVTVYLWNLLGLESSKCFLSRTLWRGQHILE